MREILSGEMCYLWEVSGDIYGTQEEADTAADLVGTKPNAVQALKQALSNNRYNYYLVRKVDIQDEQTIRKQALAKLTPLERKVLGI